MRIDPDEVTREIREAYAAVRPDGPFLGADGAVTAETNLDGDIVAIAFDEPVYRITRTDDLGAAIVAAHREARETAIAAKRQAVFDVLARTGVDTSPERWSA
jgi:hypothetical protein